MKRPVIGITIDNCDSSVASGKYESNIAYSRAIADAGGLPLLLPQEIARAADYVELCDGIMLTGGDDARTEMFGIPAHPAARCIDPQRQAFEFALLDALAAKSSQPTLGVCLGMQLMALHAGGRMNQHLPDTLANAVAEHQNNHEHPIQIGVDSTVMLPSLGSDFNLSKTGREGATVVSSHHQAVTDAGHLRVIATALDGVIEAIDDPARPYYLGVQWHPERGVGIFNFDLIQRFVETCAQSRA
jgi:putative glutamine amidotransferase